MQVAESTGKRFHRSTAKQIEYWADLGRSVSSTLDPDVLLSVISGLTILKAEPVFSAPIEPESVFETLENDRKSGLLQTTVTAAKIRYQASVKHPSYLEQVDLNGKVVTGKFENGQFIIAIDLES